ncbi:hypothetical protein H4219_006394, partial [Mycoemilia scoparia]
STESKNEASSPHPKPYSCSQHAFAQRNGMIQDYLETYQPNTFISAINTSIRSLKCGQKHQLFHTLVPENSNTTTMQFNEPTTTDSNEMMDSGMMEQDESMECN